jgi:hypothetical protein
MVRPHVAKGEGATFFARVDPKALSLVNDPSLRAPAPPPPAEITPSHPTLPIAILVALSALALFALALAKSRVLPREAAGVVPIPPAFRAGLAGIAFGVGVMLEAQSRFAVGAVLVAIAMILCAWRIAPSKRPARGPASWIALKTEEAFASVPSPGDWLDATTRRGLVALAAYAIVVGLACHLSRASGGAAPYIVAIDAFAVVPIFFTGTSRQLPITAAREGLALAPVARALADDEAFEVAPFGRGDETRLFVSPRLAMPGVVAIEIGVAWERCLPSFDVLVRVLDGSFAAAKMAGAFPKKRALPGRKPEERVFRFEPEGPAVSHTTALARALVDTLHDRRIVIAQAFAGSERRLPPNTHKPARSLL